MSFVMPRGARDFFRSVDRQREGATKFIMFDEFYCCLMLGLDARRIAGEADLEGDTFLPAYPENYRAQADVIAGLLIDAELERKGIEPSDAASIQREMVRLIDPTSPTRLSGDGVKLLNLYAAEGFAILREKALPPASVEDLLLAYLGFWYADEAGAGQ